MILLSLVLVLGFAFNAATEAINGAAKLVCSLDLETRNLQSCLVVVGNRMIQERGFSL